MNANMIVNTHEPTFICYTRITSYQYVLRSNLYLMIMHQIIASIFFTLSVQILYLMCRQFVASVFGHQLVFPKTNRLSSLMTIPLREKKKWRPFFLNFCRFLELIQLLNTVFHTYISSNAAETLQFKDLAV